MPSWISHNVDILTDEDVAYNKGIRTGFLYGILTTVSVGLLSYLAYTQTIKKK